MSAVHRRTTWFAASAVAALAAYAATAGAATDPSAPVHSVKTSPSLFPAFRPDVRDYVVRCGQSGMQLKAKAANGGTLTLDGQPLGPVIDMPLNRRDGEATNLQGDLGNRRVTYHIRCLPSDFPKWKVRSPGRPQSEWFLMTPEPLNPAPSYVAIVDRHGVPVWWMKSPGQAIDATLLPHNRIAWALRTRELLSSTSRPFEIHALDGRRTGTIETPDVTSDWHELRPLPNGHFLLLGDTPRNHVDLSKYKGPRDATVLDGVVEEVTASGKRVWKWSSRNHIPLADSERWFFHIVSHPVTLPDGRKAYDLVHLNAAEPYGSTVVLSSRHTDAIYAVSRATGRVAWKLGGTHTNRSLAIDQSDTLLGGQHDLRSLPDGTLTVHDNRTLRFEPPRALRIRLFLHQRRAQVIEQVSEPSLRSFFFGSARKLPGGDWVVSWGGSQVIAELRPNGKTVLRFDLAYPNLSYRVEPVLPGRLAASALRRGMDAMAAAGGG